MARSAWTSAGSHRRPRSMRTPPGRSCWVFPTIAHLERLVPFASVDALLAHARDLKVEPVLPRVIVEGDSARVLMPGDRRPTLTRRLTPALRTAAAAPRRRA